MRPIWFALRRRAGLVFSATVVITGSLAAPAFAIPMHIAGGGPGSANSSTDLIGTGGVLLAVIVAIGAVMFRDVIRDLIRDRSRTIVDAGGRRTRGWQSRPQH